MLDSEISPVRKQNPLQVCSKYEFYAHTAIERIKTTRIALCHKACHHIDMSMQDKVCAHKEIAKDLLRL